MAARTVGPYRLIPGKHQTVFVVRASPLTGKTGTVCMAGYSVDQLAEWLTLKQTGKPHVLIQNAFPTLTNEEREFLLTGLTPDDWRTMWGNEGDGNG